MDQDFTDLRLRFTSGALPEDTFDVVTFAAEEGLSTLYAVTVRLVSSRRDLDLDAVMGAAACFTIHRRQDDIPFHGVLETFTEEGTANGRYFYQARLRPRLWRLTLTAANQVFVSKSLPEVLEQILRDGGLAADAFAFRLRESYSPRNFTCQYGESHYDFFLRWLARNGLYYFFEQGPSGEVAVITDTKIAHVPAPGGQDLVYARTSGLEGAHLQKTLHDLRSRRVLTPAAVVLKDYNYRKPDLDLTVEQSVPLPGQGETYAYGDHYRTPDDGNRLAKVRTEALAVAGKQVSGQSYAPWLRPGYTFTVTDHFNRAANTTYLALTVAHQGRSALAGVAGLGPATADDGRMHYENAFTALDAAVQYRMAKRPRPSLAGLMTAHVDAAGSGTYAELDDAGRYKIRLPFDQSGLADGKASAPVRMLQPFVGAGFGLHCPLHKGTEVALGYLDGNPDRPVILGAAPNPENKSQVTNENQTKCCLTTAGGHKLHFEDQEGSQRILLHANTGDFLRIGAHNDPVPPADDNDGWGPFSAEGIKLYAPDDHWLEITCKNSLNLILGECMLNVVGWKNEITGAAGATCIALKLEVFLAHKSEFESISEAFHAFLQVFRAEEFTFTGTGNQVTASDIRASESTVHTALSTSEKSLDKFHAAAKKTEAAGSKEKAAASKTQLFQTKKQLAAQKSDAVQRELATTAQKKEDAAWHVRMNQKDIDSTAERIETITSRTATESRRVQTAVNKVTTLGNELTMMGIYEKN